MEFDFRGVGAWRKLSRIRRHSFRKKTRNEGTVRDSDMGYGVSVRLRCFGHFGGAAGFLSVKAMPSMARLRVLKRTMEKTWHRRSAAPDMEEEPARSPCWRGRRSSENASEEVTKSGAGSLRRRTSSFSKLAEEAEPGYRSGWTKKVMSR